MANYTTNLELEKPLESEAYDIKVFNRNMDKIDTEFTKKLNIDNKATSEDAISGVDDNKYLTSKKLKEAIENFILQRDKEKYHIGKIIIETSNTNPATYLGFGTWVLWGAGKVPVGININDTDFNTVEKTGGEKEHILLSSEIPEHLHTFKYGQKLVVASGSDYGVPDYAVLTGKEITTSTIGEGLAHNNLQPYITCYMWKRIE